VVEVTVDFRQRAIDPRGSRFTVNASCWRHQTRSSDPNVPWKRLRLSTGRKHAVRVLGADLARIDSLGMGNERSKLPHANSRRK
jgi:hypothetical protein